MVAPITQLTEIEFGIPGSPGAGVSPSEKTSFVLDTGDTITGEFEFHVDGSVLDIRKADGTTLKLLLNTTNASDGLLSLLNNLIVRGYSDGGSTQTFQLLTSSGSVTMVGSLTIGGRVIGEAFIWSYVIDGGGSTIATGVKPDIVVPYNATIHQWWALGDQTGSIAVDLWKDSYANYPPTVGDSMVGAEKPTISTSTKGQDTSLNGGNGWAVTQGQIIRPNVDSVTSLTRCTLVLVGVKA